MLPKVKARILNRSRWNIGCATRVSITQKTTRSARPPIIEARTHGLVQPIRWRPYGWMP